MGLLVNVFIRLSIIYFLGEVLLNPEDSRFAGKAIPIRNLIIVLTFSMLIPALYFWHKKGGPQLLRGQSRDQSYPIWEDNLYLSLFWLDMAGNSFNLYDTYQYFDLLPHFHGTGALAVLLAGPFGLSFLSTIGIAHLIHTILEAQEYYTDVFFNTHNVRGIWDTVNDLVAGIVAAVVYTGIYFWIGSRANNRDLT